MLVEYVEHKSTGKFGTMRLITNRHCFENLNISSVIDLYASRAYAKYDKTGCKNLISAFKSIYFGNKSQRLSKQAREKFFNDDRNFELY
jgi:hypothetical protein